MTIDDDLRLLAHDERVFDEDAKSIAECLPFFPALKRSAVEDRLHAAVQAGTWEQVYKHGGSGRVVKAYRPTRRVP